MVRTILAQNRRARHDYTILDTFEAGLVLAGSEVKAIRQGKANIKDSFAAVQHGELYLMGSHIACYTQAHQFNHEEKRPRKLLVHRKELNRLIGAIQRKGITLVPLNLYFNERGRVKIEMGTAKGRDAGDRREAIKERDWQREKGRILKGER